MVGVIKHMGPPVIFWSNYYPLTRLSKNLSPFGWILEEKSSKQNYIITTFDPLPGDDPLPCEVW